MAQKLKESLVLPSIDELELLGRDALADYHDTLAAQEVLPELEEYMEWNYRATLENAIDAWLEAHGFDDPKNSWSAPEVRDLQKQFLFRVGKERGLDKI